METKIFELSCTDNRKSFYGKAKVIITPEGVKRLLSYNTIVCEIDSNGNFRRLWDGYSVTTMRHIKAFTDLYNIPCGGADWWRNLEVVA